MENRNLTGKPGNINTQYDSQATTARPKGRETAACLHLNQGRLKEEGGEDIQVYH